MADCWPPKKPTMQGARRALACARLRGLQHLTSPRGSAITITMPLVRKSMGSGAPQTISLTSQGCQKQGQAAKIKGPVERGIPSLTCWLGTWLSLTLNYRLDLRNWWCLQTLWPEEIRHTAGHGDLHWGCQKPPLHNRQQLLMDFQG